MQRDTIFLTWFFFLLMIPLYQFICTTEDEESVLLIAVIVFFGFKAVSIESFFKLANNLSTIGMFSNYIFIRWLLKLGFYHQKINFKNHKKMFQLHYDFSINGIHGIVLLKYFFNSLVLFLFTVDILLQNNISTDKQSYTRWIIKYLCV